MRPRRSDLTTRRKAGQLLEQLAPLLRRIAVGYLEHRPTSAIEIEDLMQEARIKVFLVLTSRTYRRITKAFVWQVARNAMSTAIARAVRAPEPVSIQRTW